MDESIQTVIIGGGQAGLSLSYYLGQKGCEHVVLEKAAQPGEAWRNQRWDSFTLVTPNWTFRLPGGEYDGDDPRGVMPRQEIVRRFEQYVERNRQPVRYNTCVTSVRPDPSGTGYVLSADGTVYHAKNVVLATGFFQQPRIPAFASSMPPSILQIPSGKYRNPQALPAGAVLVVGSAQSGGQIAEELYQSGRKVYLATGTMTSVPRSYRGKDVFDWLHISGFIDRTPDMLPSPAARSFIAPSITGKNGGHVLNLHQFYRDGVVLLGHARDFVDGKMVFAPDLKENLDKAVQGGAFMLRNIDEYIAKSGLPVPAETLPVERDAYQAPEITQLDLQAEGIQSIIWACGFYFDASPVELPLVDSFGFPLSKRGVTPYPGLYTLGFNWQSKFKSGFLFGVGEDAAELAERLAG